MRKKATIDFLRRRPKAAFKNSFYDMTMSTPFLENYDDFASGLPGSDVTWLEKLRRDGNATYRSLGLPGPRVEAWKYTNLTRMGRTKFVPALNIEKSSLDDVPNGALDIDAPKLVLVNGLLRPDLSDLNELPNGICVESLASIMASDPARLKGIMGQIDAGHPMPMLALNTAYLSDGVMIDIAAGVDADIPIHIVSVGTASDVPIVFHPRNLVYAGANSRSTIYESHVGLGTAYLNNVATEVCISEGGLLRHRKLQNETEDSYHIAATAVSLDVRAQYENYTLNVGGRLARNEIHVAFTGREADCKLYGAYIGQGSQHIDTTTFVDHAVSGCTSREVYKGALDDNARGVFQGKILVRKDAQKTDGHQLNKVLLLSEGSEIDAKPELEIYADDVKCSHGATAGELDEEQLFYLRARGLKEAEARDLLVAAFLEDSLEVIDDEAPRDAFRNVISNWLVMRRRQGEG